MRLLLLSGLLLCACGGPRVETGREGRVTGTLDVTPGTRGNAWVFLYPPDQGPPLTQSYPEQATAVSDVRIKAGDTRFTFAQVEPNTYRLWGFLDTNADFQTEIDVLGGPGAGDRGRRRAQPAAGPDAGAGAHGEAVRPL